MNQKDLIKYGLIALGVYLVWKYVQDHGGIEGLFGGLGPTVPHPGITPGVTPGVPAVASPPGAVPANPPATQPVNRIQPVPVLDMTGLTVMQDINDSLTGVVKINGVPIRLAIITADGRIFDNSGSEVSDKLQSQGIDIVALRNAFQAAPVVGVSITSQPELAGLGTWTPPWLM